MYWLAYLHFGRLCGRGIPVCEALCNSTTKAIRALIGLVSPALFVTGAFMWWNRVVRRWLKSGPAALMRGDRAAPHLCRTTPRMTGTR